MTAPKPKILVIDDEESIRFTFEAFLVDEGYDVTTAKEYSEAVALIEQTDFDLIFADIILGGKTGIEVVREIRARDLNCPVVMVTGDPNIETASEALRLGAFDYIPKPVNQETLLRIAHMALKHKALFDEKERYRLNLDAIFRSVKDGIITVDRDLRVVEANEAAARICGLTRAAIGLPFGLPATGCLGKCLGMLRDTIEKRQPQEMFRVECRHDLQATHVVTLSTSPLFDHQGMFSGAVIVVRDETRLANLERDLKERMQFHDIIGKSEKMQAIYALIESLADLQTTVLITGESGTGKELVAEALHFRGVRAAKPLVKVNCAALAENLLESELFGHVRGAFTGAVKDKVGRFERADRGTIFLDEIGDISPRTQIQLLRVLQEMEFDRVGDSRPTKVDVRVIAATNQDLSGKIKEGQFREDLYYRLKVVEIRLPALRERREDIPLLVEHFIGKFNSKFRKDIRDVSGDVRSLFMEYLWPGNIRELEHALEHAFILSNQNVITVDHLPSDLRETLKTIPVTMVPDNGDDKARILSTLEKTAWNKAKAARLLGINRKTLYLKMSRYHIPHEIPQ